jgi:hypothetical protein
MSQLSRHCWIINISQPYRPPRPVTGIAFYLFYIFTFRVTIGINSGGKGATKPLPFYLFIFLLSFIFPTVPCWKLQRYHERFLNNKQIIEFINFCMIRNLPEVVFWVLVLPQACKCHQPTSESTPLSYLPPSPRPWICQATTFRVLPRSSGLCQQHQAEQTTSGSKTRQPINSFSNCLLHPRVERDFFRSPTGVARSCF